MAAILSYLPPFEGFLPKWLFLVRLIFNDSPIRFIHPPGIMLSFNSF